MLKDELEAIIKSDNIWAGRSTLVLAIGILGEYVALPFFEKKDPPPDRNAWFTSRRNPPPQVRSRIGRLGAWQKPLKIFFAVLVVAGISGEYEFSSRIASNADRLQQLSDQDLTAATNTAGAAFESAANATRDAGNARLRAGKLEVEAAQLRKDAVGLQRDVAEARSIAASANLARIELEARIAPRTLGLSEREFIGKALRRFAFSFFGRKVKIHWQSNDLEAVVFGVEIRDALRRASIEVETDGSLIIGNTGFGVRMTGAGNDLAFLQALDVLLRTNTGSAVTWEVNPKYIGLPVSIDVAAKPPLGLDTLGQILPDPTSPQAATKPLMDRHLTREQQSITARQLRPFIGQRVIFALYCGFRRRRTLIPKGTRTAFRAEGERFSERSDAGTSIVPEVFGFVKSNLSGA